MFLDGPHVFFSTLPHHNQAGNSSASKRALAKRAQRSQADQTMRVVWCDWRHQVKSTHVCRFCMYARWLTSLSAFPCVCVWNGLHYLALACAHILYIPYSQLKSCGYMSTDRCESISEHFCNTDNLKQEILMRLDRSHGAQHVILGAPANRCWTQSRNHINGQLFR